MTLDGLSERIDALEKAYQTADEKMEKDAVDRHRRIGEKLGDLKYEIDRIGADQRGTASGLEVLRRMPVDATKLVLSTKSVIGLVACVLVIVAGIWNLNAKMDAQQRAADDAEKIRSVQMGALRDAVADAKTIAAQARGQYEMTRIDIQSLKDQMQVLKDQVQKGKHP